MTSNQAYNDRNAATLEAPSRPSPRQIAGGDHVMADDNLTSTKWVNRFWSYVDKSGPSSCWGWTGVIDRDGYGRFEYAGHRNLRVHRVSYELLRVPIPPNGTIDHLCRNRACVNPDHLEVVTPRENTLRGVGAPAINARKTHCKFGHEFTPENTGRRGRFKYRECRICIRERSPVKNAKKRAKRARLVAERTPEVT